MVYFRQLMPVFDSYGAFSTVNARFRSAKYKKTLSLSVDKTIYRISILDFLYNPIKTNAKQRFS